MTKVKEMTADIELKDIWKRPNYKKMKDSGVPVEVVAKIKMIRDDIPKKPRFSTPEVFYETVQFIMRESEAISDFEDFQKISDYIRPQSQERDDFEYAWNKSMATLEQVRYFIKRKKFLYTEDEKLLGDYWVFEGERCWIENGRLKVIDMYETTSFTPAFRERISTGDGYVIVNRATRKALRIGVKSEAEAERIIRQMVDIQRGIK